MTLPKAEQSLVGQPDEQTFIAQFNGISFEEITFSTNIAAVLQTELIPVQRANNITRCIDIPIGHDTAGMRALISKAKISFLVPAQAHLLTIYLYQGYMMVIEGQFRQAFGNLMPPVLLLGHA